MATYPDPSPDTIAPQSPDELVPLPQEPEQPATPDEDPMLPPDTDQPDIGPQEVPDAM